VGGGVRSSVRKKPSSTGIVRVPKGATCDQWVVVLCSLLGDGAMITWRDVREGSSVR